MNQSSAKRLLIFSSRRSSKIRVPGTGIEPALSCENQILSLARLPIPPSGLLNWGGNIKHFLLRMIAILCCISSQSWKSVKSFKSWFRHYLQQSFLQIGWNKRICRFWRDNLPPPWGWPPSQTDNWRHFDWFNILDERAFTSLPPVSDEE